MLTIYIDKYHTVYEYVLVVKVAIPQLLQTFESR